MTYFSSALEVEQVGDLGGHSRHDGGIEQSIQTGEQECTDYNGDQDLHTGINVTLGTVVGYGSFGTDDGSLSTYHYVKNDGSNLFVFWTHGRDYTYLNKEEKSRQAENAAKARPADGTLTRDGRKLLKYERPGDCFATRPGAFTLTGEHMKAFKDPVWVDLFTGRVYEFPKANQVVGTTVITFHNVPVYDSPCVLTERANIPMMSTCWFKFW